MASPFKDNGSHKTSDMAKQLEQLEISRRRAAEEVDEKEVEQMVIHEKPKKPVSFLESIFNKMTLDVFDESESDRNKRLRRELKEYRAQERRTESLKKHGVNLLGPHGEVRIVLLGKIGIGKSLLGNNLLKRKVFKSSVSFMSVKQCTFEERQLDKYTTLLVIDTPGLFDTKEPNETTSKEIVRSIALAAPGPHIYIFVIGVGRFTPEEVNTVNILQEIFGERVLKHVIVVFTRKDELDGAPTKEFVENAPTELKDLLQKCGHRFAFINNKAGADTLQEDVDVILDLIFQTIGENQGAYYTNDMYEEAEKIVDGKRKEIQNEKERQQEKLIQEKNQIQNKIADVENQILKNALINSNMEAKKQADSLLGQIGSTPYFAGTGGLGWVKSWWS